MSAWSIAEAACLSASVALSALLVTRRDVASTAYGVGAAGPSPQIAVGGSVAYGAYDTLLRGWVTRLEWLPQRNYASARLRILNAARNGGNSGQLLKDLRRLQRRAHRALIIIAYGLNDFDERVSPHLLAVHVRDELRLLPITALSRRARALSGPTTMSSGAWPSPSAQGTSTSLTSGWHSDPPPAYAAPRHGGPQPLRLWLYGCRRTRRRVFRCALRLVTHRP